MTASSPGPAGPNIFSLLSAEVGGSYRVRKESFAFSMLGQAVVVGILIYFTSCVIRTTPGIDKLPITLQQLPLIFSGHGGGGGGGFDRLPASHGALPRASLNEQFVAPTVKVPTEMPKLAVEATIAVAPEVKIPQGGQLGDPMSEFSKVLSNGPGGRGGMGHGCCNGVGDSEGPSFGTGPRGVYPAGKAGVTVPQVIYSPEPVFSDEARKAKTQGVVVLMLVVGKDGRTSDIYVQRSLGMGLDEKAIDAVNKWRFRPATLNGQPVATQIAVEVEFHLY
jgi:protein TonB